MSAVALIGTAIVLLGTLGPASSGSGGSDGGGTGSGTCSFDAHHKALWCSLRTLNAQNNTASIQSASRAKIISVQCSDVFFYESVLRTNHFGYLPNLVHLNLEYCKIRRIPSLAFSGLSGLHDLVIRTHNSEWSAMVMELGTVSNEYHRTVNKNSFECYFNKFLKIIAQAIYIFYYNIRH